MDVLEIYLKSGHTVKVKCDEWEFSFNKETLEYNGYTFNGLKFPKMIGLVPNQIAGYSLVKSK